MQNFFNKIKPSRFFIFAAILCELTLTFVRPAMQSPDEFFHFCRAYQISEGNFLPVTKDKRVGGDIPVCVKEFYSFYTPLTFLPNYKITRDVVYDSFELNCNDSSRVFIDFPNTSTYSPVAYLPHSLALFVLRSLDCSIAVQYYGAKFFAFVIYLLCMVAAIKSIPIYKWLVVALLLLPMNVYMVNSFTGDTMTNLLVFTLLAQILKHRFSELTISRKDLALLFLIGILLAFTKVIYTSLLILLVIIPAKNFVSNRRKYLILAGLILIPFILANFWSSTIMKYYPTFEQYNVDYRLHCTIHPKADPHQQMQHLLQNKLHLFKVVYYSVVNNPKFYLKSYIGHFGTYMDSVLPDWFVIMAFTVLILIAIFEKNTFNLLWTDRLMMLLAVGCAYCLIILSQHLVWNDVGAETFPDFQGRYLTPLFPFLFMLLNHSWLRFKINPALVVVSFIVFNIYYCSTFLYSRYSKEVYKSLTDFRCDTENVESTGFLSTNNPQIKLDAGGQKLSQEHRSGKQGMAIAPDSARSFIYRFKDIKVGDLVEIYAWQKGSGGELVVKGQGEGCQPYRFRNLDIQLVDKNGWKKMQMIFTFFFDCKSTDVEFFICNPGKETIYFDDVRYRITKF